MPVGAGLGAAGEDLVDQVGEPTGDREEGHVARRPRERDPGLDQMARAVELVAHLEVGPPPVRIDDLAPAVQVAVGLLRSPHELDRLGGQALQLGRRPAAELPRERLEPLVDVGVAEDHAAADAFDPPGGDAQVVERPGPLELGGPVQDRHLAVRPLALAEQPTVDPNARRIDRPEPNPRLGGRHDTPNDVSRPLHARSFPVEFQRNFAKRFAKRFAAWFATVPIGLGCVKLYPLTAPDISPCT